MYGTDVSRLYYPAQEHSAPSTMGPVDNQDPNPQAFQYRTIRARKGFPIYNDKSVIHSVLDKMNNMIPWEHFCHLLTIAIHSYQSYKNQSCYMLQFSSTKYHLPLVEPRELCSTATPFKPICNK